MKLLKEAEDKLAELEPVLADYEQQLTAAEAATGGVSKQVVSVTVHYSDGSTGEFDLEGETSVDTPTPPDGGSGTVALPVGNAPEPDTVPAGTEAEAVINGPTFAEASKQEQMS